MDNRACMTPEEYRAYKKIKETPADQLKKNRAIGKVVLDMLDTECDVQLEDGTMVSMTMQEKLVAKRLQYELENPKHIDLNAWQKVKGEAKDVVEVQNATDLFGDLVIKEKDETE